MFVLVVLTTLVLLEMGTNVLDRLFMSESVTMLFPPIVLPSTVRVYAAFGLLYRLMLTTLRTWVMELLTVGAGVSDRLMTFPLPLRWWVVL